MDSLLSAYGPPGGREEIVAEQPPLKRFKIDAAPEVPDVLIKSRELYIPDGKEMHYNVPADLLYRPREGPTLPHLPNQLAEKNVWNGSLAPSFQHDHSFDEQYNTYQRFGYAHNPEAPLYNLDGSQNFVGNLKKAEENGGTTVFNMTTKQKRTRKSSGDASSDRFLGPWAPYEGDIDESSEEEVTKGEEKEKGGEETKEEAKKELDDGEEKIIEKTILHKKERYDYLGRTYLAPPSGLKTGEHDCFLPKKRIHTWSGHTKPISSIKLFPNTGHLLLSSDLDGKVKLWDVYNKRRVLRTFLGHSMGIKDVCFSTDGTTFLTASLDRQVKLWDTESGQVISRFAQDSAPLCLNFYPENNNSFLTGLQDKRIAQWDCRANEVELYYDRHLGPVNSVTFADENRRFVSTSDDKSIRVWDFNTPVEIKYISEPYMHSMPRVAISASQKWLALQSMDNQILIYSAGERFKLNRKKAYRGHVVAGYACQPNFSPDGKYIISGDSSGFLYVWDWKTQKIYKRMKAHDRVCISAIWHPVEQSKVISAGWDGRIHLWD